MCNAAVVIVVGMIALAVTRGKLGYYIVSRKKCTVVGIYYTNTFFLCFIYNIKAKKFLFGEQTCQHVIKKIQSSCKDINL